MVKVMGRKPPLIIFTLYLVVAVMGVSAFSANPAFQLFQDGGGLANPRGFLHSISHNVDFLAECPAAAVRSFRNTSFSLRLLLPSNMQNGETYFTASSLLAANECFAAIPKNSILINLRI